MQSLKTILKILSDRGKAGKEIRRVYRYLCRPETLQSAYIRIGKNRGAMTPGVDGETVDGTSLKKLDRIAEKLHRHEWKWKPVRRVYLPKPNGATRPLGIPTWKDRLVQEAIRLILNAYYEPQFHEQSYGFREGRGCHDALCQVKSWDGTKWFIELDIKGCFDNIDHDILISILERRIKDRPLIKLIRELLNAGVMKDWTFEKSYSGTPQGGIASPLLANIYLNELDCWIEKELLPQFNRGQKRHPSALHSRLRRRRKRLMSIPDRTAEEDAELLHVKREMRRLPTGDPDDSNFRRLKYVRYADDCLLGFIGPKAEAAEIKERIGRFLKDQLRLEMSEKKTLITHATSKTARFLGYEIRALRSRSNRQVNGTIGLFVPYEVMQKATKPYCKRGKPHHNGMLIHASDCEIVRHYDYVLRGLYNYYCLAQNVAHRLYRLQWILQTSMFRTLAGKHRSTVSRMARRLKRYGDNGRYYAVMISREGRKPLTATFGNYRLIRRKVPNPAVKDGWKHLYPSRTDLEDRLFATECELCGATEELVVHHIRAMKTLKEPLRMRTRWAEIMHGHRRKTLVVCEPCHDTIHGGKYDGKKLS